MTRSYHLVIFYNFPPGFYDALMENQPCQAAAGFV